MPDPVHFQWQNDVLLKTIYPLREMKLRDFLIYYKEIDLWAQYSKANLAPLQAEYTAARKKAVVEAYKLYASRRDYFLRPVTAADLAPVIAPDAAELARINNLHQVFKSSFKYKDVRKEKYFVSDRIYEWELHRNEAQRLVASKQRRINSIRENNAAHPSLPKEETELKGLQTALDMAQIELERLRGFLASFDKIEKRKLALFNAQNEASRSKANLAPRLTDLNDQLASARRKAVDPAKIAQIQGEADKLASQIRGYDQTLAAPEEAYVTDFKLEGPLSAKEVTAWKMEEYRAALAGKNHQQLLEEIVQRFVSQPQRYPLWLQYMVIHFSGMRYQSAHGSWADPKDLLINLRSAAIAEDLKKLDEGAIAAAAEKTRAAYANPALIPNAPKLTKASEPEWKEKIAHHLRGLASVSASAQRSALLNLRIDEENYEIESLAPDAALEALKAYKTLLPDWMWKEIISLTQLRLTEVKDPNWEKLTDQQQQERYLAEYNKFRQILDAWKERNITSWREEHDKTNELIVTRSVCNEVAEQIQHLRGWSPPGGLTPKAGWYKQHETEKKIPGNPPPYIRKPASRADFTPGASILWLRFVSKAPNPWQTAKPFSREADEGLLPASFLTKKAGPAAAASWTYAMTDPITRTRKITNEKKVTVSETQYLRWIHEATVVEVADTAEDTVVLTFETALPYDDRRLSSVGINKHQLSWLTAAPNEKEYNQPYVGYLPEGEVPAADLEHMLDWNKILRRNLMTPQQLEEYRKKNIRRTA